MSTSDNIRIFISYSHDSKEHKERVLQLAKRLESNGIDCYLDDYVMSPPEGWPRWMRNQIRQANFVLVICTKTYRERYEGIAELGTGVGAKWEGLIITQEIYEAESRNSKFIPITFSEEDAKHTPIELRSGTWHVLNDDEAYLELYARITNQPRAQKGPLGEKLILPPAGMETTPHKEVGASTSHESQMPALEVLGAALEVGVPDGTRTQVWGVALKVFVLPKDGNRDVIPFHRCKGELMFPNQNFKHQFSKIAIRPSSRNSATIIATETEAVINGPGTFILTAEITLPYHGGKPGGDAHVTFDLYLAEKDQWASTNEILPICMSNYHRWERGDSLTVFDSAPFVVY